MTTLRPALLLPFIALLLGACTTPTRESAQAEPAAPLGTAPTPASPAKNLRKGMTEVEIRTVWGEPKSVQAGKQDNETILIYQFDVLSTQKMVATAVKQIPAVDPVTGETRVMLEPVLTPQQVTVTQTIVLQLIDGQLVSWARQLGEERSFN